ncbi:MAG: carboxypeptidase regulatory-like domain-containing protein [Euzebyaceae bacterium]|nr:carboxypeptidase regulatory-like domain-containing protein [Euzebyaceae bacterium]
MRRRGASGGSGFRADFGRGHGQPRADTAPRAGRGHGVRGRVTDSSGEPIELATIMVARGEEATAPARMDANVTDADGRYFLPLPPGPAEVTISAHRQQPVTLSVVVPEGEPLVRNLVLEPADA